MRLNEFSTFLILLMVLTAACDREYPHPVPDVLVSFEFNVLHYNLSNPGFSAEFNREVSGGYGGIFVYRQSLDEFKAFDRACPTSPHSCILSIDADNVLLVSSDCCNSIFLLIDGSVLDGTSEFPLKQYRASFDPATNRVRISNF